MKRPGTYPPFASWCITLMLSIFTLAVHAQHATLTTSVDRDHILPGERIVLTLEAKYPTNFGEAAYTNLPDNFRNLEVLKRSPIRKTQDGSSTLLQQEITLTGFEAGQWTIPSLYLVAGKEKVHSDSLRVTIDAVKLTDSTYHDIRDIIEVPDKPFDWKKWGAIALSLLIVGGLLWNYLRGRKNKPAPAITAAERSTAYEEAQKELKKLKAESLPAKGEMKIYYTRLYDILRDYLRKQGSHPDKQRTTSDLLLRLRSTLNSEQTGKLAESLRMADAVKFAKYASSADEAEAAHDTIGSTLRILHQQKTDLDQ